MVPGTKDRMYNQTLPFLSALQEVSTIQYPHKQYIILNSQTIFTKQAIGIWNIDFNRLGCTFYCSGPNAKKHIYIYLQYFYILYLRDPPKLPDIGFGYSSHSWSNCILIQDILDSC